MADFWLGMSPGASPSVAARPGGGWLAAYEADTGMLSTMDSSLFHEDLRLGLPR